RPDAAGGRPPRSRGAPPAPGGRGPLGHRRTRRPRPVPSPVPDPERKRTMTARPFLLALSLGLLTAAAVTGQSPPTGGDPRGGTAGAPGMGPKTTADPEKAQVYEDIEVMRRLLRHGIRANYGVAGLDGPAYEQAVQHGLRWLARQQDPNAVP